MEEIKFSIVVPVYNEQESIEKVLKTLHQFLSTNLQKGWEIVVVNDGSTDRTKQILDTISLSQVQIYNQLYNKGYGASLKAGTAQAKGEFVAFYDGDGQHNPQELLKLLVHIEKYDMVVGSRNGYNGPAWRRPGKKLLGTLANYLVSFKIPDLNSGLRVLRKTYFHKFEHLYPNGFSLSTTITLAFLKQGYGVKYIPINVEKRVGKSSVCVNDGFKAIMLAIRMTMLFSPFKVFFPTALFLFILGIGSLLFDVFVSYNIGDTSLLLIISAIIIFFFGLLADQVSAMRRELKL